MSALRPWIAARGAMGEGVLTPVPAARLGFHRIDGEAQVDAVSLDRIAESVGTPSYVYSASVIRSQYRRLNGALSHIPHRIHYSVKANSSLAILALLRGLGAGVDIVSGGELFRALRAGFTGRDVVFSGVGKTEAEIEMALEAGVLLINVESDGELALIESVARRLDRVAPVALRANPEVTVDTPHPYTRTGEKGMKFGIPWDDVLEVARRAVGMRHVRLAGLDMHIGSQVTRIEPYQLGLSKLLELVRPVRAFGAKDLAYLDIGGGLAVTYEHEKEPDLASFAEMITPEIEPTGLELIVEPGRFLVGNAGALLTRVLYRKRSGGKEFVIVDAGMNDLLRPSHYNAYHRIETSVSKGGGKRLTAHVVGPVCESGDFLALDRELDDVSPGDLLVVQSAGAYGYVMSSNYTTRPRPAEVLVDGDRWATITEREQYEDLVRHERLDPEWRTF